MSNTSKGIIAFVLVLLGTNLFTFATTRYWTTSNILPLAVQRMNAALTKEGHEDLIYPPVKYPMDKKPDSSLFAAVSGAGGMYYWWNAAIIYWLAGVLFIITAIGFRCHKPQGRSQEGASPAKK